MKIGIISDTHNDMKMADKAIEVFRSRKVDIIIHAGDLTSPKILDLFKGYECRFVLGNCDIDVDVINIKSKDLGFGSVGECCDIDVDGKRIFILHGDDVPLFRRVVASGEYDYIIKGHTHSFEDYISNDVRIINPGSLYEKGDNTIAVLDTQIDRVEKIKIEKE